jgi:hypothetical protein
MESRKISELEMAMDVKQVINEKWIETKGLEWSDETVALKRGDESRDKAEHGLNDNVSDKYL